MNKSAASRLPLVVLKERRRRAVKLRERDTTRREVAAEVELSVSTVIARTIADLADSPAIETVHLGEAPGYRHLNRAMRD